MNSTLKIALLQLRAFDLAEHDHAWAELLRRIDDAAAESPRLIVAPEAAYPAAILGSSEAYAAAPLRGDAEVLATLGDRARRHACYLAVGLVLHDAFGAPQNAAVLIAPGGAVIARATESAPAASWFAAGQGPVTALVDDTRIALFAGADALDHSRVATAVEGGARVLVSTSAATTWGHLLDRLPEPEGHLLLAARAVESGTWAVTPSKVGIEAASRVYGGRAGVVSPSGTWVARAPSDRPGIALHTLDLDATSGPPVVAATGAPIAAPESVRLAVLAVAPTPSVVDLMEGLRAVVRSASAQGARLLVLPDLAGTETRAITSTESLPLLEALSAETQTILAVALAERGNSETYKTAYLIDRGTTVASHRQSVLRAEERTAGFTEGTSPPPVVVTSAGGIGLLCGAEGFVPSLAAGLVERGASLLTWCAGDIGVAVEPLARTRAIEVHRTVVAAGVVGTNGGGGIIDARGSTLATTVDGQSMAAIADRPLGRG